MKADRIVIRKCPTAAIWWVMRGDVEVGQVRRYCNGFRVSVFGKTEETCGTKGMAFIFAREAATGLSNEIVEIIGLMGKMSEEGLKRFLLVMKEVAHMYPKGPPAIVIQFPTKI